MSLTRADAVPALSYPASPPSLGFRFYRKVVRTRYPPAAMNSDVQNIASLAHQLQQQPADENDSANGGLKRKAEDGGSTQQRARRNRYVSIAW